MAQINTESIENFDAMSPEEKVTALLGYQFDDGADKVKAAEENAAKMKAAFDKAASEAAGYKKQLNATLSDDEKKRNEDAEIRKQLEERLAEFEQRERISTAKAAFLGGGFDEATAADAANAFIAGDIEKMSAAVKKYRESIEVQTKSRLMDSNPKQDAGSKADDSKKSDAENIASKIGKLRADEMKKAQEILEKYTRR